VLDVAVIARPAPREGGRVCLALIHRIGVEVEAAEEVGVVSGGHVAHISLSSHSCVSAKQKWVLWLMTRTTRHVHEKKSTPISPGVLNPWSNQWVLNPWGTPAMKQMACLRER